MLDRHRRVMLLNRAMEALTGFHAQEAFGLPCWYILRGNLCGYDCPVCQSQEIAEPLCVPGDLVNRNRQRIHVRITIATVRDAQGNVAGYLECFEDTRSNEHQYIQAAQSFAFGKLLGSSHEIQGVFRALPTIAQNDSPILITGETGTGKHAVAQAIHQASSRVKGPFIRVNCGALPEHLLESELFGHQQGAFAGALEDKPGRFRLAHNGTVFLSEIGDLPLSLQGKLLAFLDDKVVHPAGSSKGIHVDARLMAATHRDLRELAAQSRFRDDLLHRLNVVRVHLPPLVKRGSDIRLLLDHFLHVFGKKSGKKIKGFSEESRQILLPYSYPGNVLELRNIVEYAVSLCEETFIRPQHLPPYLVEPPPQREWTAPEELHTDAGLGGASSGSSRYVNWADAEQQMILDALMKAKGKRTEAAKLLGWGRSTLWRKMKRYGIGP
jgi:two-component system, NtrC family, response regulator AtoC